MLQKGEVETNQGSGFIGNFEDLNVHVNGDNEEDIADMPALVPIESDDKGEELLMAPPSSDSLPPLMEDSDVDEEGRAAFLSDNNAQLLFEDNVKTIQQVAEILSLDPSCKCFGPCGGKTCKERDQWQLCRNNFNDFVKCKNIVGEQCQISHDGYCRICIIAGSTASKRYLSIYLFLDNLCSSCYHLRI